MTESEPKWISRGDVSTHYRACYQINGAPRIVVSEYENTARKAQDVADKALDEALADIAKHKVVVEASSWNEKHQSRTQYRTFLATDVREVVVNDWHGTFRVISKGVWESEQQEIGRVGNG